MTVIVRAFRRRPRRYAVGVVLLLAAVAGTVWLVTRASAATEPQLATARVGTLSRTVSVTGTIEPRQRADLDFTAGGQVVAVDVAVGQQVAAGQRLAAVDAASLPGQVAQARSTLAAARARLAADRSAGASNAQLDADEAAVSAAQAQLDVARKNESQATLAAPFAGTVAAVTVSVGEQLPAGGGAAAPSAGAAAPGGSGAGGSGAMASAGGVTVSTPASEAAVVIVSTGSFVVEATVDDTQVGQLVLGQDASITPNGATEAVPGTVSSVGLVATSTGGVASYPVVLAVTGSPPGLHIGASAEAEIATERIDDAVLVPSAAVRGAGAAASVTVDDGGRRVDRPVTVGATAAGRTQIVSGLAAGEQVVLPAAPRPGGTGSGGFGPPGGSTPPTRAPATRGGS